MTSGIGESYREGLLDLDEAVTLHLKTEFTVGSVDPKYDLDPRYNQLGREVVESCNIGEENVWFDLPMGRGHQMRAIDIIKFLHMETFIDKQVLKH